MLTGRLIKLTSAGSEAIVNLFKKKYKKNTGNTIFPAAEQNVILFIVHCFENSLVAATV